jgi:peptidoglycan biosynthesis protein MviN/MurJ (putative lipid II flippase)
MRFMLLKAGVVSLLLLVLSRVLGLVRESVQAAMLGTGVGADLVVLLLTLPDWLVGTLASGALAYGLLPHWARLGSAGVDVSFRQVMRRTWWVGVGFAVVMGLLAPWLGQLLVPGAFLPQGDPAAARWTVWAVAALLPWALMAALWATRLQHGSDFVGVYGANLVVNGVVIASVLLVGWLPATGEPWPHGGVVMWLAAGLLVAMLLRLGWLGWRLRRLAGVQAAGGHCADQAALAPWPAVGVWGWAALAAGLPLLLPLVVRSWVSQSGQGALAEFHYAWKLVELPLGLAIQLAATLSLPRLTRAFADAETRHGALSAAALMPGPMQAARLALVISWALGCACAAGLLVAAPELTAVLFGWGRMPQEALVRVAEAGWVAAWGLLPQAALATGVAVLAAQRRLQQAAWAMGVAALFMLGCAWVLPVPTAPEAMGLLNGVLALAALWVLRSAGHGWQWLPWRAMLAVPLPLAAVLLLRCIWPGAHPTAQGMSTVIQDGGLILNMVLSLLLATFTAMFTIAIAAWTYPDARQAMAGRRAPSA